MRAFQVRLWLKQQLVALERVGRLRQGGQKIGALRQGAAAPDPLHAFKRHFRALVEILAVVGFVAKPTPIGDRPSRLSPSIQAAPKPPVSSTKQACALNSSQARAASPAPSVESRSTRCRQIDGRECSGSTLYATEKVCRATTTGRKVPRPAVGCRRVAYALRGRTIRTVLFGNRRARASILGADCVPVSDERRDSGLGIDRDC